MKNKGFIILFTILFTVVLGIITIFSFVTDKNLHDLVHNENKNETAQSNEDSTAPNESDKVLNVQNNTEELDNTDQKELTTHRYELFDEGITQEDAIARCQELGGHLLTITSKEEQEYINNKIAAARVKNIWLGAKLVDGNWEWITGEEFSFQNWVAGEPNNVGKQQTAIMMYTYDGIDNDGNTIFVGGWNDESPNGRSWSGYTAQETGYICEWE